METNSRRFGCPGITTVIGDFLDMPLEKFPCLMLSLLEVMVQVGRNDKENSSFIACWWDAGV